MFETYRPKQLVLYRYGFDYKAIIECYPQSRWECVKADNNKIALRNKNIRIELEKDDFERNWRACSARTKTKSNR